MKKNKPLFSSGQGVNEYIVIGALVALLAVPVLFGFGGTISGTIAGILTTGKSGSTVAVSNAPTAGSLRYTKENPLTLNNTGPDTSNLTGKFGGYYDPATQTLTYPNASSLNSGGHEESTAGSRGDEVSSDLANQMLTFVEEFTDENGNPLDPGVVGMIKELHDKGHAIAKEEAYLDNYMQNVGINSSSFGNRLNSKDGLVNRTKSFAETYNNVMSQLYSMPNAPSEVKEVVYGYSGVISNVSYHKYMSFHHSEAGVSSALVGYKPANVSQLSEQAVQVTRHSSDRIGTSAEQFTKAGNRANRTRSR